ncbi:hypothetical protein L7F22_026053 [Adiantum nelumboides]|nr:hypothetical protein [Adiantum nelumboides]
MNAAINALVKTENDELRMNCIALLSSMAQQSLISIRFQQTNVADLPEHCNEFARDFAVALKGSLISSDSQVQKTHLMYWYGLHAISGCFQKRRMLSRNDLLWALTQ